MKLPKYRPLPEEWEEWKELEFYPYPRFQCKCGCGGKIKVNYRWHRSTGIPNYVYGHQGHFKNKNLPSHKTEIRTCICGCGLTKEVSIHSAWCRFRGHSIYPTNENYMKYKHLEYYPYPKFMCQCGCKCGIKVQPHHKHNGIPHFLPGHANKTRKIHTRTFICPTCGKENTVPIENRNKYCNRKCAGNAPSFLEIRICKSPHCHNTFVCKANSSKNHCKYGCHKKGVPDPYRGMKRSNLALLNLQKAAKKRSEDRWCGNKYSLPKKYMPLMKELLGREDWNLLLVLLFEHRIDLLSCFYAIGVMCGVTKVQLADMTGMKRHLPHRRLKTLAARLPAGTFNFNSPRKGNLENPHKFESINIHGSELREWFYEMTTRKF